jgi:hypothetical protein
MNASTSNFHKFFTPIVHPVSVVKAIIVALDEQHSMDIYTPFYTHFVPYVRILPSFGRDFFQWVSSACCRVCLRYGGRLTHVSQLAQADSQIQGFVKVTGRRPDEPPLPEESGLSKKY